MVRFGNNLVGILNFLTFLLSIPVLAVGIWLSHRGNSDCEHFLDKPIIALGAFLIVVSLAGFIGACYRVSWLLWFYLLVTFLMILSFFSFTIFAFVVTNKGAGEALSGKGYKEYRLGHYSEWLQKRVDSEKNWSKMRSCLQKHKVCKSLIDDGSMNTDPVEDFYSKHLSAVQSGCCKPPNDCNFTYVSSTNWTKTATLSTNPDCDAWENNQNTLCLNCQSCKAGLLDNLKNDWKKVAILNVIFLVVVIIVYSIGCYALRNNRDDNSWKQHP